MTTCMLLAGVRILPYQPRGWDFKYKNKKLPKAGKFTLESHRTFYCFCVHNLTTTALNVIQFVFLGSEHQTIKLPAFLNDPQNFALVQPGAVVRIV